MSTLIAKLLRNFGIAGCKIDVLHSSGKYFARLNGEYLCDDQGNLLMFSADDDAIEAAQMYFRGHLNKNMRKLCFNTWITVPADDLNINVIVERIR